MNIAAIASLEQEIDAALTTWNVPGAAVAIVKDGQVVSCRGYGVRTTDDPTSVDENTLFALGSVTKPFTATGLALLVDEGRVQWDDPVIQYLPDFQTADPWVTGQMTLVDLLSHRTGWGRAIRLSVSTAFDAQEIVRRLRWLPFSGSFRDSFGYNNFHYLLLGRVIEVVSGQRWEDFTQERLLDPLGMKASRASFDNMPPGANRSAAHLNLDESQVPHFGRAYRPQHATPWLEVQAMKPAGGIASSAHDLCAWLKMWLESGRHAGLTILQAPTAAQMLTPAVTTRRPAQSEFGFLTALNTGIRFYTYGLGWSVMDYRGRLMVFHGGQITGFVSWVTFFPEENLGYAILLNVNDTLLHAALNFKLADLFLGYTDRDWLGELKSLMDSAVEGTGEGAQARQEILARNNPPVLPMEAYQGVFANPFMGNTTIRLEGGRLMMHYGNTYAGELRHLENNTFLAAWEDRRLDWSTVIFPNAASGRVDTVLVDDEGAYTRLG